MKVSPSVLVLDDTLNSFGKYCSCPKEFIIKWISTEYERWSNDAPFLNVHGDTQYGLLISGSLVNMMVFLINNIICKDKKQDHSNNSWIEQTSESDKAFE